MEPDGLAVLGSFYRVTSADNPALDNFIEALSVVTKTGQKKALARPVTLDAFLPEDLSMFYRYNGSLTTPGCFESVQWTVFDEVLTISRKQLKKFRKLRTPKGEQIVNNFR